MADMALPSVVAGSGGPAMRPPVVESSLWTDEVGELRIALRGMLNQFLPRSKRLMQLVRNEAAGDHGHSEFRDGSVLITLIRKVQTTGVNIPYDEDAENRDDYIDNMKIAFECLAGNGVFLRDNLLQKDFDFCEEDIVDGEVIPTLQLLVTMVRHWGWGGDLPVNVSYKVMINGAEETRWLTKEASDNKLDRHVCVLDIEDTLVELSSVPGQSVLYIGTSLSKMEGQCASEPGIIHVVERSETGASVSGWHCTIKYKEKEITTTGSSRGGFDGSFTPSMPTSFVVVDANSRNGTRVTGEGESMPVDLKNFQPRALREHDTITLGMGFHIKVHSLNIALDSPTAKNEAAVVSLQVIDFNGVPADLSVVRPQRLTDQVWMYIGRKPTKALQPKDDPSSRPFPTIEEEEYVLWKIKNGDQSISRLALRCKMQLAKTRMPTLFLEPTPGGYLTIALVAGPVAPCDAEFSEVEHSYEHDMDRGNVLLMLGDPEGTSYVLMELRWTPPTITVTAEASDTVRIFCLSGAPVKFVIEIGSSSEGPWFQIGDAMDRLSLVNSANAGVAAFIDSMGGAFDFQVGTFFIKASVASNHQESEYGLARVSDGKGNFTPYEAGDS